MILDGTTRTEVVRWKVADLGDRALHVEARVRTFVGSDGSVGGLIVSPFAIIVREPGQEYVVPLAEGEAESFGGQLLETLL